MPEVFTLVFLWYLVGTNPMCIRYVVHPVSITTSVSKTYVLFLFDMALLYFLVLRLHFICNYLHNILKIHSIQIMYHGLRGL